MPNLRAKFEYDYGTVMKLTNWPYNRLMQDVHAGKIDMDNLASVCLWLCQNGEPRLRGAMASHLLGDLLARSRGTQLETQLAPELLTIAFKEAEKGRKAVAKKCGRRAKA